MAKKSSQNICTDALKKIGWTVGRTESYSGFTGQCSDLFGFLDAVGISPYRVVGLQFCGEDYSEHIRKIEPLRTAIEWHKVNDCYLIGVKKMTVKLGGKQERWCYRVGYFKSTPEGRLKYTEIVSWKDRNFDLEFLPEYERKLFSAKVTEVLTK